MTAAFGGTLTAPTGTTTIFTAGANGSLVPNIHFEALVTVAAAVVYAWLVRSGTFYLLGHVTVAATTLSSTGAPWSGDLTPMYPGFELMSGDTIAVGESVSQAIAATISQGGPGDF